MEMELKNEKEAVVSKSPSTDLSHTVDRSHIIQIADDLNDHGYLPRGMRAFWRTRQGGLIEFGVIYPTAIEGDAFAERLMESMRQHTMADWPASTRDTYHPERGHLEMTPKRRRDAEGWGGPIDWDAQLEEDRAAIIAAGYPASGLDEEVRVVAIQARYARSEKIFYIIPEDDGDRD